MRHINFGDNTERQVAEALDQVGIEFIHESEAGYNIESDFFLPHYGVYIEVKRFRSERGVKQVDTKDQLIVLQGLDAVKLFIRLIMVSRAIIV